MLVSLFFIAYVLFEVPSNMLLMKIKPSIYLSTIVWVWGCVVIGMSQSKSGKAFLAGRFFLGMIEAGLFPGALFLLSCWYTKREIGMDDVFTAWCQPRSLQESAQASDSASSTPLAVWRRLWVASWREPSSRA